MRARRSAPLSRTIAALAWTASVAVAQEAPLFPTTTQLVTIDAVVVDREGRPVTGLSRDDFLLEQDGEPRAITHFEAVTAPLAGGPPAARPPEAPTSTTSSNDEPPTLAPRSFVIVYDDLHVGPLRAAAAREAVDAFLRREVRAGERVALVAVGSGAWWAAEIPEGREDLLAFLDGQAVGRGTRDDLTDVEAQRIVEYDDAAVLDWVVERRVRQGQCQDMCEFMSPCDPKEGRRACTDEVRAEALRRNSVARHGLERTLATMASAMAGLAPERGRKSLVLVSEGFPFDPGNPAYREVVQASLRANTAIHFLDVRGLQATSGMSDASRRGDFPDARAAVSEETQLAAAGAEQVAEDSGGFAIRHGNDLAAGLARVAREAETYYLLGFEPPLRAGPAAFRKVTVRVGRPGLEVRARKGYFVDSAGRVEEPGDPERPASTKPAGPRGPLPPSLVPRRDLRLQAAAYVGPAADRNRAKVRLVAEVDLASLGASGVKRELDVRGDVWPRDGKQWVGLARRVKVEARAARSGPTWHALTWDVALPPGVYQARLRFRDTAADREGTLTHRFEVPRLEGLRFASPIVTDVLQRHEAGSPSLAAGAGRTFEAGPGRSLYVQLELLGVSVPRAGGKGIVARVVLRDGAGRDVRAVPPGPVVADAGGRLVRALGFTLDDLAPGSYVLLLEGRDERTGATRTHEEALILTAAKP